MRLVCVSGHDRCSMAPDESCPYCERRLDKKEQSVFDRALRRSVKKLNPK